MDLYIAFPPPVGQKRSNRTQTHENEVGTTFAIANGVT